SSLTSSPRHPGRRRWRPSYAALLEPLGVAIRQALPERQLDRARVAPLEDVRRILADEPAGSATLLDRVIRLEARQLRQIHQHAAGQLDPITHPRTPRLSSSPASSKSGSSGARAPDRQTSRAGAALPAVPAANSASCAEDLAPPEIDPPAG